MRSRRSVTAQFIWTGRKEKLWMAHTFLPVTEGGLGVKSLYTVSRLCMTKEIWINLQTQSPSGNTLRRWLEGILHGKVPHVFSNEERRLHLPKFLNSAKKLAEKEGKMILLTFNISVYSNESASYYYFML